MSDICHSLSHSKENYSGRVDAGTLDWQIYQRPCYEPIMEELTGIHVVISVLGPGFTCVEALLVLFVIYFMYHVGNHSMVFAYAVKTGPPQPKKKGISMSTWQSDGADSCWENADLGPPKAGEGATEIRQGKGVGMEAAEDADSEAMTDSDTESTRHEREVSFETALDMAQARTQV